jgi:hypothetical protein
MVRCIPSSLTGVMNRVISIAVFGKYNCFDT